MTRTAPAALLTLISICLPAQDNTVPAPEPVAFSLVEGSTDLSPHGINASSCISVTSNGHFHIEMRFQQLPQDYATLHIYESSLDDFQMQRLKNLLNSQSIRDLAPYTHPITPMLGRYFSEVYVHIPREHTSQNIGYLMWDEQTATPNASPESTPAAIKEEWRSARTTLVPLVQWFHEVEGMKWPEVPASRSNLCGLNLGNW
ncbi:hypothetical protein EDE15_0992 [Edaphobacter aggregans]|uniref:Uncharacterized protein n=1 Tax=Edaphobacter aggregans TaxID=570835 RepID=A0A3R9Q830_9BACT|nr:hypothetical protein [Edaphobacter aggregans]RSL15502.1 hypothetical protein EDE15_0992 [Edaphobacter aggregans]